MVSITAYRAYGLSIHTELACPELSPLALEVGKPDLTIRLLQPAAATEETLANGYYEVLPGLFRLDVPGVARYRVEDGSRIFIEPRPDVPLEKVRLFLLGSVMGAVLYQRGFFPLHGSAVETPWGAMIFVGNQGAGKSTLAAQFIRRGYRLLSDDVCAVAPTSDGFQILPALAHFRLCADAFERFGPVAAARFDIDKFVVPMGESYCPHSVPLAAIHILADHDEESPRFQIVRGFNRVQRLLENLYRPHYLKGQETERDLMRLAGRIAEKAALVLVTRRRNPDELKDLVGFLESAWSEHFTLIATKEKF
jgi:hypothetical protein